MPAVSVTSTGKKLPPLYWNNSNPLFNPSTPNRITVNLYDSIEIYCPYSPPNASRSSWEYYVIYLVSESEYNSCTLFDPIQSLMIINCSNPSKDDIFFTMWMDPFQGIPNTHDFRSGNTYYIMTTSTGKSGGLSNQVLGACNTSNMKLEIHICCSSTNNNTQHSTSTSTTTPGGQNTQPPVTTKVQTPVPTTKKPMTAAPTQPPATTQKTTTTTNYPGGKPSDPSQNIVIDATGNKNSGLINSAQTLWPSWTILLILTMTLIFFVRIQR